MTKWQKLRYWLTGKDPLLDQERLSKLPLVTNWEARQALVRWLKRNSDTPPKSEEKR